MVSLASTSALSPGHPSQESDYGSDFSEGEEDIVNQLLRDLGDDTSGVATPAAGTGLTNDIPELASAVRAEGQTTHDHAPAPSSTRPAARSSQSFPSGLAKMPTPMHPPRSRNSGTFRRSRDLSHNGVDYPDLSHALENVASETTQPSASPPDKHADTRSPLQRFRSFPRKPLTVSDLSSGAWCEMQYWYTLTRLPGGRKTRTPAMKGGTKVHQTLEDQVHTTVHVSVAAKEEAFGLRIWNLIQGLRTLRDTGMTRELEVWGMLDGEVTNGIIDELSFTSPNLAFEEELRGQLDHEETAAPGQNAQPSIATYFQPHRRRVYLTDVKTRASTRLPSGAALRPARVQLFLYHRLLSDMASGKADYPAIVARYGLNSHAQFSDAFMAQIGGLHDEVFYDADSDPESSPSTPRSPRYGPDTGYPDPSPDGPMETDPPHDLMRYRSIEQLIPLLQSELRETFPQGADSIGDLLAVQYRHRDDGRIIGNNSFPNDPEALDGYLRRNLEWWRGSRRAEGVPIEETYKCRSCEFVEVCEWRMDKEAEILQRRNGTAPG